MTSIEVLKAARARIRSRRRWCQGGDAYDKGGEFVFPHDADAYKWCAAGAVRSIPGYTKHALKILAEAMEGKYGYAAVIKYNDSHTHKEVLAKFDEAIGEK